MRCPMCREDATGSSAKPFCSERCRRADLAKWLDGTYRILGERVDPMTFRDAPGSPLSPEEQS